MSLPAKEVGRLDVVATLSEVRFYTVSAADTLEVVCEYLSEEPTDHVPSPAEVLALLLDGGVARLEAGLPDSDESGWLRIYVTAPTNVPLRLCDEADA